MSWHFGRPLQCIDYCQRNKEQKTFQILGPNLIDKLYETPEKDKQVFTFNSKYFTCIYVILHLAHQERNIIIFGRLPELGELFNYAGTTKSRNRQFAGVSLEGFGLALRSDALRAIHKRPECDISSIMPRWFHTTVIRFKYRTRAILRYFQICRGITMSIIWRCDTVTLFSLRT